MGKIREIYREETKGRFRKRGILANVPWFRSLVSGNIRMHPRTSKCTLVPVFGTGEHLPKPPFGNRPFANPESSEIALLYLKAA